ncbi:ubiquitin carboxyl-terminal hydrolase 19 [Diplocarpon rosae]|nr:ubiquitin carboxyl-terminal hydrolase 19 [Diplocarpon rosae]
MDSQFTATREDLYHVQMDVRHLQAVQTNHADRLLRLERRQADDAALKSVWGPSSPFPGGILSGTPQQGPVPNASADVFDDFDDEQGQNLLGSLQFEAEEEPVRRGASRANSVRFDVSALQGSNWATGSRISGDFAPTRPNSGFGNHPMTERTLSHKSDGRHSSAGHSVHSIHSVPSGRTSSLGLDTNFMIGGQDDDSPIEIPEPPPGLFILGSVPSIIRCWLTTNFSHNALLYAAVCTGAQKSTLDYSLVQDLGLADQAHKDSSGRNVIKLPVYLPEAIITQPTSRSNSPAPQLPALSADFEITRMTQRSTSDRKKIRVFLGSDTLRAHSADILLSQNLMVLYGDDRNKLSVPFVRPEDENVFKNLQTANVTPEKNELKATAPAFTPTESRSKGESTPDTVSSALAGGVEDANGTDSDKSHAAAPTDSQSSNTSASGSHLNIHGRASSLKSGGVGSNGSMTDSEKQHMAETPATEPEPSDSATESNRREASGGIWGSWRQAGSMNGSETESTSGYQRATRGGRSMKVLKPSKPIATAAAVPSRPTSVARTGPIYEPSPSARTSGELGRRSHAAGAENGPLRWETRRVTSEEQKPGRAIATVTRSSNPVGGASAFAWMNPNKPKASATAE